MNERDLPVRIKRLLYGNATLTEVAKYTGRGCAQSAGDLAPPVKKGHSSMEVLIACGVVILLIPGLLIGWAAFS